jgi:hypothetical protein
MTTGILLFLLALFCLVGTVLGIVFTILNFANNKSTKYTWLTILFISIIGLIFSVITLTNKVVSKVENLTKQATETFENFTDSLSQQMSDSLNLGQSQLLLNNKQILALKDYSTQNKTENVPEQFYTYLGFGNYYRYPITFPYALHCNLFKDDAELFNEENVLRFDENDNGEQTLNIENIKKIAFDNKLILIEHLVELRETNKTEMRFVLFSFEDSKRIDCNSEKELFKTAIEKGYKGNKKLITIADYDQLFK